MSSEEKSPAVSLVGSADRPGAMPLWEGGSEPSNLTAEVRRLKRRPGVRPSVAFCHVSLPSCFAIVDIVALAIPVLCAWMLAAKFGFHFLDHYPWDEVNNLCVPRLIEFFLLSAAVHLHFEQAGHYHLRLPVWIEIRKILETSALAAAAQGVLIFDSTQDLTQLWFMTVWIFAAMSLITLRVLLRAAFRRHGLWRVPSLLIGGGAPAEAARKALDSEPGLGFEIVAKIEDLQAALEQAGRSWHTLCASHRATQIIIALDNYDSDQTQNLIAELARDSVPYIVAPLLPRLPVFGLTPFYLFNHDVVFLARMWGLERSLPRFLKRSFDVALSGAALFMLSPMLLAAAILASLDGGPVLYADQRLGMNGRSFTCFKFRTMVVDGEALLQKYLAENPQSEMEWKRFCKFRQDPRITRIGKFLRRTSMDELPQLINVLRGEMSIVGPRPILLSQIEK
jgi:Bacterial sugar transferase